MIKYSMKTASTSVILHQRSIEKLKHLKQSKSPKQVTTD